MNTLNLTVDKMYKGCRVYADGRQVELKRTPEGLYRGWCATEKDRIELTVIKVSEFGGPCWFLWAMLFFIISGFGIFNAHYDGRYTTVNYQAVVYLNGENNMRLEFNRFAEGQPAVKYGSDCPLENKVNVYGIDREAKKRRKIVTWIEVFLWIALIVFVAIT
ncbi:MAG: hypothetical protein K2N14_01380, partial [Clostridia bacterium]|nr:hypothetical protein [Clostridia bacterium]